MFMSPSHLMPLAAVAVQLTVIVPPEIYILPESSSSWSYNALIISVGYEIEFQNVMENPNIRK